MQLHHAALFAEQLPDHYGQAFAIELAEPPWIRFLTWRTELRIALQVAKVAEHGFLFKCTLKILLLFLVTHNHFIKYGIITLRSKHILIVLCTQTFQFSMNKKWFSLI